MTFVRLTNYVVTRMASQQKPSKSLSISLWIVQALLALVFIGTAFVKLITPVATVATMWPWAGEYPTLLRLTGVFDLLGGMGVILPGLTRIRPSLTVLAALGCVALMASAIVFHVARGEGANTPFNVVMLALALFVFLGRLKKVPINPQR